jgi:hypothetical protein
LLTGHLVEEGPVGYPRLARFLNSDECFMNYRRFGYLQTRLLLTRQDELRRLEAKLDAADRRDEESYPENLHTCDFEYAWEIGQQQLMNDIEHKFKEYGISLVQKF